MIDVSAESLVPIRDVPRLLPLRPNGKRVHISAVYRWLRRGIGRIRLESIKVGGATYTSKEALQRFADQLSEAKDNPPAAPMSTTTTRKKQIDQAEKHAQAILRSGSPKKPSE